MELAKVIVVCCCLFAAQAYAQYQPDTLEPGRLQPRPGRIRISSQQVQQEGGIPARQSIPTGPRSRRPIPIGAFAVPLQGPGQSSRGRLQLPPQALAQPAPAPLQPSPPPQLLRPAPVREEPPAQNSISQPTFSPAKDDDYSEEEEEVVTPGVFSSSVTPAQYAPLPQIPRTTAQPPLPYRGQQVVRQSRPQPPFRPESRNSIQAQPQEISIRQSRPQPRPVAAAPAPVHNEGGRERAPVAQSVRRYREDNPDGSIVWGFENDDGSFKEEVIGADCIVRGKYGYVDPDGVRREYTYTSGNPCERDEEGRLIPDEGAVEGGQYNLPQGVNDFNLNIKPKARRPKQ